VGIIPFLKSSIGVKVEFYTKYLDERSKEMVKTSLGSKVLVKCVNSFRSGEEYKGTIHEEKNGRILICLPNFRGRKLFMWFDIETLTATFSLETFTCQ